MKILSDEDKKELRRAGQERWRKSERGIEKNRCNRKAYYEAHKEVWEERTTRTRFGVGGKEHFERQAKIQKGLCAICEKPMSNPHRDHSHTTGKLRSILCHVCNVALGQIEDFEFLDKALLYLIHWEVI